MRIRVALSIGVANAEQRDTLTIDDAELKGLNAEQREEYLQEQANEWAYEQMQVSYEEVDG